MFLLIILMLVKHRSHWVQNSTRWQGHVIDVHGKMSQRTPPDMNHWTSLCHTGTLAWSPHVTTEHIDSGNLVSLVLTDTTGTLLPVYMLFERRVSLETVRLVTVQRSDKPAAACRSSRSPAPLCLQRNQTMETMRCPRIVSDGKLLPEESVGWTRV